MDDLTKAEARTGAFFDLCFRSRGQQEAGKAGPTRDAKDLLRLGPVATGWVWGGHTRTRIGHDRTRGGHQSEARGRPAGDVASDGAK